MILKLLFITFINSIMTWFYVVFKYSASHFNNNIPKPTIAGKKIPLTCKRNDWRSRFTEIEGMNP